MKKKSFWKKLSVSQSNPTSLKHSIPDGMEQDEIANCKIAELLWSEWKLNENKSIRLQLLHN